MIKEETTLEYSRTKRSVQYLNLDGENCLPDASLGYLDTGEVGCDMGEITETLWSPYTHTKEHDLDIL